MSDNKLIIFSDLPTTWKAFIIIGFMTVFIILILIVILIILMYASPKIDTNANIDEYAHILEEFDKQIEETKEELDEKFEKYPKLPKIRDLEGKFLKDLMDIEIL